MCIACGAGRLIDSLSTWMRRSMFSLPLKKCSNPRGVLRMRCWRYIVGCAVERGALGGALQGLTCARLYSTGTVPLHYERHAVADAPFEAPPVLVLHGLFGSAQNWRRVSRQLAKGDGTERRLRREVFCVDLRNHGGSGHASDHSVDSMAADVVELLRVLPLGTVEGGERKRVNVLGHSMGGKVAMAVAPSLLDGIDTPEGELHIDRLAVVDMAPAVYRHSVEPDGQKVNESACQKGSVPSHRVLIELMKKLDVASFSSRSAMDRALASEIPDGRVRAFLLTNVEKNSSGQFRWRVNLDALGPSLGPLGEWVPSEVYHGKTLFVGGDPERTQYIPPHIAEIKRLYPNSQVEYVADSGHWLHADRPDEFLRILVPFLDEDRK